MDTAILEKWIRQGESDTVDFKAKVYDFEESPSDPDRKRFEFIKDFIAMANTPREEDAWIVCGVAQKAGGKCYVVGVDPESIQDESFYLAKFGKRIVNYVPKFKLHRLTFGNLDLVAFGFPPETKAGVPVVPCRDCKGILAENKIYLRANTQNVEADAFQTKRVIEWFGGGNSSKRTGLAALVQKVFHAPTWATLAAIGTVASGVYAGLDYHSKHKENGQDGSKTNRPPEQPRRPENSNELANFDGTDKTAPISKEISPKVTPNPPAPHAIAEPTVVAKPGGSNEVQPTRNPPPIVKPQIVPPAVIADVPIQSGMVLRVKRAINNGVMFDNWQGDIPSSTTYEQGASVTVGDASHPDHIEILGRNGPPGRWLRRKDFKTYLTKQE